MSKMERKKIIFYLLISFVALCILFNVDINKLFNKYHKTGYGGCTDECILGNLRCYGSVSQKCGNYDSDSCLEWGDDENCYSTGCDGNYKVLGYCGDGVCKVSKTECEFGCSDGSCNTCSDECGQYGIKRCNEQISETCGYYDSDSCLEWGGYEDCYIAPYCDGDTIKESYCDSGECVESTTNCDIGCKDGECISSECLDLQPDNDIYTRGSVSLTYTFDDYCVDELFTIIDIGDTQNYMISDERVKNYETILKWIVENKDAYNIKMVLHVGDMVDEYDNINQFNRLSDALKILDDAGIPYGVVTGNHEHKDYDTDGTSILFDNYFPTSKFSSKPYWGGNYNGMNNNYYFLNVYGGEYIILMLDWCPSDDEIIWANTTFSNYPDKKGILVTHGYLDDSTSSREGIHGCNHPNENYESTEYIWDKLVKHHKNLQVVLCGHEHDSLGDGEAFRIDNNVYGNPVYQMLANYQSYPNGGNGWIRILEFSAQDNKIHVMTYSPVLDRFDIDNSGNFDLDYNPNTKQFNDVWQAIFYTVFFFDGRK